MVLLKALPRLADGLEEVGLRAPSVAAFRRRNAGPEGQRGRGPRAAPAWHRAGQRQLGPTRRASAAGSREARATRRREPRLAGLLGGDV